MYREQQSGVAGVLLWSAQRTPAGSGTSVLPDGCMDLIWHEDGFLVAGPDTRAHHSDLGTRRTLTALRCAPGVGPALFGTDACELRDQRVPLDQVWSTGRVRRLSDAALVDPAASLVALAREQLADADLRIGVAVAALLASGESVAGTADAVGWSERRLHRHAVRTFGYGPKTLGRVLRFRRAVDLARSGSGFAAIAYDCGYSDQAHLAREIRAMSGTTLGDLAG
ncbi:helix-turn-helix domain-containing protein [Rhodococcus phenolicus]|uniref:helix-turn-helix domain-containing protein n=1 Tax=Rhodococcus phenolicus TaxID=263849 RepID=UPI00082EFB42|nr:helix-turn-helix domain-containing protein [Rhodococcus phenolicus]